MKWFGAIFAAFGLLFMAVGGTLAWNQHRKISTWMPVEAVIISTDIERHTSSNSDGGSSTTYKPIVVYRYNVAEAEQQCDEVLPISQSSSHRWARSITRRFRPGQVVEAYYNPNDPREAFLLREHSFFPYIFILFPSIFVCIGVGVGLASGASPAKPPLPLPGTGGWFEVKPARSIAQRQRASLLAMMLWDAIGLLACGHFFMVAERPYGLLALIATGIYASIGCAPLAMFVYFAVLSRNVTDARLFIMTDKVKRGESVTVGARQQVKNPLAIEQAAIGFRCQVATRTRSGGKTTYSTHTAYEQLETVLENHQARAGENMEYSTQLTLPEVQQPSTPPHHKDYPRRAWSIRVRIKLADSPDYKADFPVIVE